jgi:uncharacterized phage-associated protein
MVSTDNARKPGAAMTTACDVAAYILAKSGPMTAWKLQKLVYYSQAWSLVWDQRPMFQDRIEAWANGPVCPSLYNKHRGQFIVERLAEGNPNALDSEARETVDAVLAYYGNRHPQWLSDLTHMEAPWKDARGDLAPGAVCDREITHEAMAAYYESL